MAEPLFKHRRRRSQAPRGVNVGAAVYSVDREENAEKTCVLRLTR